MNISTLSSEHYAAVDALMEIKAHTQKAIDRARATIFSLTCMVFAKPTRP